MVRKYGFRLYSNDSTPTTNIDTQNSSGFIYDESKYTLSEGLASEAFINEVWISVGGVIVSRQVQSYFLIRTNFKRDGYISVLFQKLRLNCKKIFAKLQKPQIIQQKL
jgi:hypothetical protein